MVYKFPLPHSASAFIDAAHVELEKGLAADGARVPMLPAFIAPRSGVTPSRYYALDFGGTNIRFLAVDMPATGPVKPEHVRSRYFPLSRSLMNSTADELYARFAECVAQTLDEWGFELEEGAVAGYTFSYPTVQTGLAQGTLLKWTKEVTVSGCEGEDVVTPVQRALDDRLGAGALRLVAVLNDTTGTMLAGALEHDDVAAGLIVGTGSNLCYLECLSAMGKLTPEQRAAYSLSNMMAVNTECGNLLLPEMRLTEADLYIDRESAQPGEQMFEKQMSGMYLGEIVRVAMLQLVKEDSCLLSAKKAAVKFLSTPFEGLETSHVGLIDEAAGDDMLGGSFGILQEVNGEVDCDRVRSVLGKLTPDLDVSDGCCRKIAAVCRAVGVRASAYVALLSVACAERSIAARGQHNTNRRAVIAGDGSVYTKYPKFRQRAQLIADVVCAERANKVAGGKISVQFVCCADGSGVGAAAAAAMVV